MLWPEMLRIEKDGAFISNGILLLGAIAAAGCVAFDTPPESWIIPIGFTGGALLLKLILYVAITRPFDAPIRVSR